MKYSFLMPLLMTSVFGQVPSGPIVGAVIPSFELADQNGQKQTLSRIAGPKGTLLVFFRSADW